MPAPHELVGAPLTLWIAPTGTAYPTLQTVDGSIAGTWVKLGALGSKSYDDGGVEVLTPQTIETFTGAGGTAPRKAFRTEEGLALALTLADISPEQFALAMNNAAVTTVAAGASTAGQKHFSLLRGVNVAQHALLARGQSPVDNALVLQWEVPTCFQSGDVSPTFDKGKPAGLAVEFTALEVTENVFGTVRHQTAVPSS